MYKIIPWNKDLDLTDFYKEAEKRGFVNNASQKAMIDCFRNEEEWQVWILYYNDRAVGSVAAHSIEEGYRICTRTCAFTDLMPVVSTRTRTGIITHQHVTAQFFMPACIEWAKEPMYITTHPSKIGTQRQVHTIWGPSLEKTGVLTKDFEKDYRGHVQTFWKLNTDVFLDQLNKYPKW
tara:strand:- start:91 stop:624 length:534 start_codon:yes stop_codon:yes gene_type:complete